MELGQFMEKDIIAFLESRMERKERSIPEREEDFGLFLEKDYMKELSEALEKDELTKAKALFDDLKEKYNKTPRNSLERRKIYSVLEAMYKRIEDYVQNKSRLGQLVMPMQANDTLPVYGQQRSPDIFSNPMQQPRTGSRVSGNIPVVVQSGYGNVRIGAAQQSIPSSNIVLNIYAQSPKQDIILNKPDNDNSKKTDIPQSPEIISAKQETPIKTVEQKPLIKPEIRTEPIRIPSTRTDRGTSEPIFQSSLKQSQPTIPHTMQIPTQPILTQEPMQSFFRPVDEKTLPEPKPEIKNIGSDASNQILSFSNQSLKPETPASKPLDQPKLIDLSTDEMLGFGTPIKETTPETVRMDAPVEPVSHEHDIGKKDLDRMYEHALFEMFQNNYAEAMDLFKKILAARPQNKAAMIRLHQCEEMKHEV